MPSVYRGPGRWLRYWYLPAAALLAAGIAFAIVVAVEMLVGDPDSDITPAASTTVFSETPMPTVRATPTPEGTPDIPDGGGESGFAPGQAAIVTGTGDCLNMRSEPSINGAVITCLPDGSSLSIVEGPEKEGSRIWWRVEAAGSTGWVAEEYLSQP